MQKTKSLLQPFLPEVLTIGKHLTLVSSSPLLQNYAHPSSEDGSKSFASSSFKETEGVHVKLSLLKMLLVSNRESIRRNNRWKRKKKKKREDEEDFDEGAKKFEGVGRGRSKILVELFSRKRNWTASLCRN